MGELAVRSALKWTESGATPVVREAEAGTSAAREGFGNMNRAETNRVVRNIFLELVFGICVILNSQQAISFFKTKISHNYLY